jgi:hypothetical protein
VICHWGGRVQPGDPLITFNWDLLHKSILWRAGKWHFADGYGFRCFDAPSNARSETLLLKLHGSVNWAQSDEHDMEPGIVHKATFFPDSVDDHRVFQKGLRDWSDGHRLIIPTYLKDVSTNRLLLHIWAQDAKVLSRATEIIVIGSDLHPADAPARLLFALAFQDNDRVGEIVLVSPNESLHWNSFCPNLGKRLHFVPEPFEQWVSHS